MNRAAVRLTISVVAAVQIVLVGPLLIVQVSSFLITCHALVLRFLIPVIAEEPNVPVFPRMIAPTHPWIIINRVVVRHPMIVAVVVRIVLVPIKPIVLPQA